ncbi:putative Purine nucleoside permease [Seiridium cardinale]|uniref:Purine nucleoside permease n=1 Tax=Seiridium cardinale TaxID=138064 RepID=A0ABR2XL37_9PEZI
MRTSSIVASSLLVAGQALASVAPRQPYAYPAKPEFKRTEGCTTAEKIAPKVLIISMFYPEADIWYENLPSSGYGDLFAQNITVPGLSPIYPQVHCTSSGEICQVTAGEAEINAAASISSLMLSTKFDFTSTYVLMNGIAGVSPKLATLGSVALSKFSVQVALQYEFDSRELPSNFSTGYIGYDNYYPGEYPEEAYGTEVMELNEALRDIAFTFASQANLSDSTGAQTYRAKYAAAGDVYTAAVAGPSVVKCDSATSDVYYSGNILGEAFDNTTKVWTNQTEYTYCMTAQEDSAVLQSIMRAHLAGLADYSRTILVRTASDFDRPPPGTSAYDHLLISSQGGFTPAVENIYYAGIEIVKGILHSWNCTFAAGVQPTNYIGDIFGSLGGEPDFGLGSVFSGEGAQTDGSSYTGYIKRSNYGKRGFYKSPKAVRLSQ